MGTLSFGSFAHLIKNWTKDSAELTVNTLLGAITRPLNLMNQYGSPYYFDKGSASRLMASTSNVPAEIQRAVSSPGVKDSVVECFEKTIIPSGLGSKLELIQAMKSLIDSIHLDDKRRLLKSANENDLAVFLAETYLFSIPRPNDYNKEKKTGSALSSYLPKLFIETDGYCPNPGCGRPLYADENNKSRVLYEVVTIDSAGETDDNQNQIALCPQCAAAHNAIRDTKTVTELKVTKSKITNQAESKKRSASESLDEEIRHVLVKIENLTTDETAEFSYDPVKIKNKIDKSNGLLYQKVLSQVTTYYSFIKETSQQLSSEGKMNFDRIATQVKLYYLAESKDSYSQNNIFKAIARWLEMKTGGSFEACEVVTSFFVQNCEIFEVINETA